MHALIYAQLQSLEWRNGTLFIGSVEHSCLNIFFIEILQCIESQNTIDLISYYYSKEQHVKHSFNTTPPSISQPNLGKT